MAASRAKLGKNVGDDFREGKITLPVVLSFRRGGDAEREFWRRTLERGEATDADLEHAIGLMTKHRALEDTIGRAQHYGAIARDALALFPELDDEAGAGRGGRVLHRAHALARNALKLTYFRSFPAKAGSQCDASGLRLTVWVPAFAATSGASLLT